MTPQRVAIVGAGPAGCAAAYALTRKGHEVVIFEKASAPGGRASTHRADGFSLDTGAGFVTNFYTRVLALSKVLGFADSVKSLNRISGLHHDGRTAPLDVGSTLSFLRFPFLSLAEKARMASWTAGLTLKRRRYDLADPATLRSVDARSIADHARDRVGERVYEFLVRPGIEPFWYFSCEEVSEGLLVALTSRAAGARFYWLDGGIDQICQQLAADVRISLDTEVLAVEPAGAGMRVVTRTAAGDEAHGVDRVVFACTATIAHSLCANLPEAWVSADQKAFLGSQRYVANIHAAFRVAGMTENPGMGSVFPCGPGQHPTAALCFHRVKDPPSSERPEELVSLYLSEAESARLMEATDAQIYDRALELARELYPGLPAQATPFHLIRRREAIPVHGVGRYILADAFQREQQSREGPVHFCGDYLATATVEGAVATGLVIP